MPSTRIAQNTQVGSGRAKKGEITLNDICLLLVIDETSPYVPGFRRAIQGPLGPSCSVMSGHVFLSLTSIKHLILSAISDSEPLFSLGSALASY